MKFTINDFILWEVIRGNSIAADAQAQAQKHFEAQRNQTEAVAEKLLQLPHDQISVTDRIRAQVIVQQKQDRLQRDNLICGIAAVIALVVGISLWQLLFTPPAPTTPVQTPAAVVKPVVQPQTQLVQVRKALPVLKIGTRLDWNSAGETGTIKSIDQNQVLIHWQPWDGGWGKANTWTLEETYYRIEREWWVLTN